MAAGEAGVRKVFEILENEMTVTMQLMGAGSISDLNPDMVRTYSRNLKS